MKAPPPKESKDQEAFVRLLQQPGILSPHWRYTHIASGEKRDKATAAKLKRMGVTPGVPDFIFFHDTGAVFWLELKRRGSLKASPAQKEVHAFLRQGGNFFMTDDINDAVIELRAIGILRAVTIMA